MFRFKYAAIASTILLCACAQQLRPLEYTSYAGEKEECTGKSGLNLTVCQADQKSSALSSAYFKWKNDPALWDVPLIAMATAAAGLLLFDASTDIIKAVGLAAGATAAGRSYFTSGEVQTALLDGSNGYACIADIGRIVATDADTIANLKDTRDQLSGRVSGLKDTRAQGTPIEPLITKAQEAIQLYDSQAEAAKFADSTMRSKARAISTGLLKRIQRKPVDFTQLYQSLAQSAKASADFELKKSEAQPPTEGETKSLTTDETNSVKTLTRKLVTDLPNIATSIGKFDTCVTNSLSGSSSS